MGCLFLVHGVNLILLIRYIYHIIKKKFSVDGSCLEHKAFVCRKEQNSLRTLKKLPVGIDNFEKIRAEEFYYVDKTELIRELLYHWGEVNLFTRPRRFGKSLNMSMLKTFFSYGCDSSLFEGLQIAEEQELCKKYMGKFPVIFISLKDINSLEYNGAKAALYSVIVSEALQFSFLKDSSRLNEAEKRQYMSLTEPYACLRQPGTEEELLKDSLRLLSGLLYRHFGQKVILLIDEYDVPLDKAFHQGYYDEMMELLRSLFSRALKGNDSLQFAVLTGCLRIAKESIFTGLNNFKIYSVSNVRFDEYFGFSEKEVREMLKYYGLETYASIMRDWYDGYRMGKAEVYCPWDVINYIDLLRAEPEALPQAFWANTSSNDIIRKLLKMAKSGARREIERLIDGESIEKKVNQELTYRELYEDIDHVWSVLFTTGYLTQRGKAEGERYFLAIPNREIHKIFVEQIQKWFQEEVKKDAPKLDAFCEAFVRADANAIEKLFNAYLQKTISIRDTAVQRQKKENFYHGILLGLLSHWENWEIRSNAEAGSGYSDILIEMQQEENIGIVIEIKYQENGDLKEGSQAALRQIEEKEYDLKLIEEGMEKIYRYGIACWKKKCGVQIQKWRTT